MKRDINSTSTFSKPPEPTTCCDTSEHKRRGIAPAGSCGSSDSLAWPEAGVKQNIPTDLQRFTIISHRICAHWKVFAGSSPKNAALEGVVTLATNRLLTTHSKSTQSGSEANN